MTEDRAPLHVVFAEFNWLYMIIFYTILSATILIILLFILKTVIQKKRPSSFSLYVKALKDENSGNLEEALVSYRIAYEEAAKTRFQEDMKQRILKKMKVLHSMKGYNKQFQLNENHS